MTGFWPGLISFLVAIAAAPSSKNLQRFPRSIGRLIVGAALLVSLYCAWAGVFHALDNWHFIDLTPLGTEAGVSVLSKRGAALALVSIWPVVMVAMGPSGSTHLCGYASEASPIAFELARDDHL